jgi:proteasome lid subunit RPN8/RPN11
MRKQANALVTLNASAQKTLLMDVSKRRRIEACGLLLGSIDDAGNWHVEQVHPLRNIFDSPVYFEFAPEDLLEAEINYPGQTVGVYHSHPTGFAAASSTDRQNMRRVNVEQQIPWVWLIVCGPFDEEFSLSRPLRRHLGLTTESPVIAYHHYEHEGLRRIPIQLEEESTTTPEDTLE